MALHSEYDCLVVGGDSLIGEHVVRALAGQPRSFQVTSRRPRVDAVHFDLAAPSFASLESAHFNFAIICAAITNMRTCEDAPAESRRVNVEGTLALMRWLAQRGTHLVFLSSSQVFNGDLPTPDESTPCAPKNEYGRQKCEVEEAIAHERLPAAVLRVPKVLARSPVGMFAAWYDALARGEPAVAAINMTIAPLSAEEVALAAIRIGLSARLGIWHLSSADEMTYYDAALLMADICGLPHTLLQGEAVTDAQVPAIFRHRYAALACGKIAREFGVSIPTAQTVLTDLFAAFPTPARA